MGEPIRQSPTDFSRVHNIELYKNLIASSVNETNFYEIYWKDHSKNVKECFIWPSVLSQTQKNEIIQNGFMVNESLSVHQFYNKLHGTMPHLKMGKQRQRHRPSNRNIPYAKFRKHLHGQTMHDRNLLDNNETFDEYAKNANEQMGLFWEFIRYFNCEWPYSYLMDQIGSKYFDHYHRFSLDDFSKHFDENINKILDALNIIDNKQNNLRLLNKGLNGTQFNITKQRQILFLDLQKEDYSNVKGSNQQKPHRKDPKYSNHATKGEYDKENSIKLLLTVNDSVCSILKNMTIMLQFEWQYHQFC